MRHTENCHGVLWHESEWFVLHVLLCGLRMGKGAVQGSTKLVVLCWRTSEEVKASEVVYTTYLEQLLEWSIPKPHPASFWRKLVRTGWNRAMEPTKNKSVSTEIHLEASPTILVIWLKRKNNPFWFFFSLTVGIWKTIFHLSNVHRTRKLFPQLILPAGLTLFCLRNVLKKHRINLHHTVCKNPDLHYVKLFWSEISKIW